MTGRDVPLGEAAESSLVARDQAQALVERATGWSRADEVQVSVTTRYNGNTRFAANQMATAGGIADAQFVVRSSFGLKHAVVTTNDLSDQSMRRVVAESERLARLAPMTRRQCPRSIRSAMPRSPPSSRALPP